MKEPPVPGPVSAVLCDLDGTLYVGDELLPGAIRSLERLRSAGIALAFVTNTTTRSRDALHQKLSGLGLPIDREEIVSALGAGVLHLRALGRPRCHFVLRRAALAEFEEFERDDERPDAVVIGDIGEAWTFALMQRLFRMITSGAAIVALHKGRSYESLEGLTIDVGAFVAGLEYASGVEATVVGKPSSAFFALVLEKLGVTPARALVVGDDVRSDVGGARDAGLMGALVRTGKYRSGDVARSGVRADVVLDSIADLPRALGLD